MKNKLREPYSVTMEQAIYDAQKEVRCFVDAETDPMLRTILGGRIDLSISNIADSIEKNFIKGSVIRGEDGSIDALRSTIEIDLSEYVKRSLKETKVNYLSQRTYVNDPENIPIIHTHKVIGFFSIREEWDFWANKEQLLADEAIPLMHGLDPTSWQEYNSGLKLLPSDMTVSIERSLKIAKAEGFFIGTPIEWLAWGSNHDLDKAILKSEEWLPVPDICMFYMFKSSVNKISKIFTLNLIEESSQVETEQTELKKIDKRNQEWQRELEILANKWKEEGKESLATKKRLAKELAKNNGKKVETIERNTLKTW